MAENRALSVVAADGASTGYAAWLLACLGAEATVITQRGDDGEMPQHIGVRRLQLAHGSVQVRELVTRADVVLYDTPADDVLGLGTPALLRAAVPSLITAAVSAFGESGPRASWSGTDLIALHAGGLGNGTPPRVTDPEREYPLTIPGDAASRLAGLALVGGVLHALAERDRDGSGRHVELSVQELIASCMFNNLAGAAGDGGATDRLAASRPTARKSLLLCADGAVTAMVNRPNHVRAWLEVIGEAAAPLVARLAAGVPLPELRTAVDDAAEAWAGTRSKHEVAVAGQARHVPVAPVLAPDEVLASSQLAARGFWTASTDPAIRLPGHPFGPDLPAVTRQLPAWIAPVSDDDLPLTGLLVVDFGWIFAAPIATRILAGLGARVLRIEHVARLDQMRERATAFRIVNGDKESALIDAKSPHGRDALLALLRRADVLAENFAPGVMARLGLDWETLAEANPRLIMLSISGMGQTGPLAHWAMLGQLAQAYSGITTTIGYPGGPPRGIEDGGFWSDPVTGYAATAALLAALRERALTGRGRRLDISLVEATVALMEEPLVAAQRGDVWRSRGNHHPAMAPHDLYRCAGDDAWLALAVRDDAQWSRLCHLIGADADDALATLAGRQAHPQRLRRIIERWSRERTAQDAATTLQAAGIAATPSNTARDVLADPHLRSRGIMVPEHAAPGGTTLRLLPPWHLHPAGTVRFGPAPALGEHTESTLALARES